MGFDFSKLKGRMVERCGTCKACAEAIGLSHAQLSMRLSNKVPFKLDEVATLCDLLGIEPHEIGLYFFTPKVR